MKAILLFGVLLAVVVHSKCSTICADHESSCPDGTTCCQLPGGHYGCCPLPHAVCCNDHIHCCPQNTQCDTVRETCNHQVSGDSVPMHRKQPALRRSNSTRGDVAVVMCPDRRHQCPDGTTCCQLARPGQYGCCPVPRAVCCSDHVHCCPSGTRCDVRHGRCNKASDNSIMPMYAASTRAHRIKHRMQPPHKTCPDNSWCLGENVRCCAKPDRTFGCCPFVSGVCCSDQQHCCPHNTRCNARKRRCDRVNVESESLNDMLEIRWADTDTSLTQHRNQICPDRTICPLRATCCPNNRDHTAYSCCPLQKAVCCKNHCCPTGRLCVEDGLCRHKYQTVESIFGTTF